MVQLPLDPIPSILTRAPGPATERQFYSMMLPRPCFMWYAVLFLHQTYLYEQYLRLIGPQNVVCEDLDSDVSHVRYCGLWGSWSRIHPAGKLRILDMSPINRRANTSTKNHWDTYGPLTACIHAYTGKKHAKPPHAERRPRSAQESDPGPCCCEVTILITTPGLDVPPPPLFKSFFLALYALTWGTCKDRTNLSYPSRLLLSLFALHFDL